MVADTHRDSFEEEQAHLSEVILFIDAEIVEVERGRPAKAAYQEAADALQLGADDYLDSLRDARARPHFGRVDFRRDDEPTVATPLYIGERHVPDRVWSWTAPVAALYYAPARGGYTVRSRFIPGRVELKRQMDVVNSEIVSVVDVLRLAPPEDPTALEPPVSDAALEQALGALSQGDIQDIVETIQPEQYEQIAREREASDDHSRGGRERQEPSWAFTRLAYLLSPFSDLAPRAQPNASRVIMLGPSPAFLRYIGNLLPSLGHDDIRRRPCARGCLTVSPHAYGSTVRTGYSDS